MSVISVAVTVQPANVPPRVKVDVTDSGTPAINAVSVVRILNGVQTPVRTLDGNPLVLTTSGSTRVGTVYDVEAPYGQAVTYSTVEYPAGVSSAVTLAVTVPWLVHPGQPGRSMPVDFRIGSFDSEEFAVTTGVFRPMGRRRPIVFTDGARQDGTGSFTVGTETLAALASLKTLIADAGVLLLQIPPSVGMGQDSGYVAILDVQVKRRSNIGTDPYRDVELPYVYVDRPEGGSQAQWTYADGAALFATYAAAQAAYPSYASSLAPPS